MKFCHITVYCFTGANAVGVVGIGNGVIAMREGGQPPAVLPGEGEAVPVGEGVADFIISDGLGIEDNKWSCLLLKA